MPKHYKLFLLGLMVFLISGCAHVISEDLRASVDSSLTFSQVLPNPDAYKDKSIVWGGQIIQTINQKDGSTLIEVFERPLGWRGKPKGTASEGRFLIFVRGYLDPNVSFTNRRITVAGEIIGERARPLGEMNYRYPLISARQIYLWEHYYPAYGYSYYYYSSQRLNFPSSP